MSRPDEHRITDAQVVVTTARFADDLAAWTGDFGFRVESIFPADSPTVAVVSGHGLRVRLEAGPPMPVTFHLVGDGPMVDHILPGGSRLRYVPPTATYELPDNQPALVVSHPDGEQGLGRAGMHYRDLIPGRWGGRFVASQISIAEGGPVADYVHFHRLRFQMIYVQSGWVRLVYEDQGDPFVMVAGDCVLQPPEIRHRVLEASPGMEVIEVACPALHETIADWSLPLPTTATPAPPAQRGAPAPPAPPAPPGDIQRAWDGQRFVLHTAAGSAYHPWRVAGWECRDTGIGAATGGLAGVRIARPIGLVAPAPASAPTSHDTEFALLVAVAGQVTFTSFGADDAAGHPVILAAGASVAIPGGLEYSLTDPSADCELLDITLPELLR